MDAKTVVRILADVTGVFNSTKGFHDLLVAHQDDIVRLIPILQNLGEAKSALTAAENAAPDLAKAIRDFAGTSLPLSSPSIKVVADKRAENLLRSLGGIGHMTSAQEAAWMDRFTPPSDSRFGGG